jgi:IS5 family transposase
MCYDRCPFGPIPWPKPHSEAEAHCRGVKQVAVPNLSTKSTEREALQHKRWFRKAMKWRTGCEGRISLLKRRHGLDRCRYKGTDGMKRWVGLGVIADNLINIAQMLAAPPAFCAGKSPSPSAPPPHRQSMG